MNSGWWSQPFSAEKAPLLTSTGTYGEASSQEHPVNAGRADSINQGRGYSSHGSGQHGGFIPNPAHPTSTRYGAEQARYGYPARQIVGTSSQPLDRPRTPEYASPSLWKTYAYSKPGPKDRKISPKVLRSLHEPISNFTFINGPHLGVSPAALPHYKRLRGILEHITNGPEHIQLLESPTNKHDLTIVMTDHMASMADDCNYTNHYADRSDGKKDMNQTVVHFDPTAGFVTRSGHYCSPLITLCHELYHSYQQLLVSAGSITEASLREKVKDYGTREEQLAIEHANTLAAYLRQGQRRNYGNSIAYYRVRDFASPTPLKSEAVKAIQDYRNHEIDWPRLRHELAKHF